jgi:hypothetical protein
VVPTPIGASKVLNFLPWKGHTWAINHSAEPFRAGLVVDIEPKRRHRSNEIRHCPHYRLFRSEHDRPDHSKRNRCLARITQHPPKKNLHQITACQECLTNNQPKTRPQWWPPRSIDSLDATPYELEHQRLSVRELMAKIVAAFGTSHSTMLFSSAENWQAMFDHVDRRAPINDFDGNPRSFEELLKSTPPGAAALISKDAQAKRHKETMDAMDRLQAAIAREKLDILIIIGDDQREVFKDNCRPAIAIYYGETIRNAAAPSEPVNDWY